MQLVLRDTRLGLRDSHTRIPFRYGVACLTQCPQAVLEATIEVGGRAVRGYSGDCLPPLWFDKSPQKTFDQQIGDMVWAVGCASREFLQEFARPNDFFSGWLSAYEATQATGRQRQLPPLLMSFGVSLLERAIMDALARAANVSLFDAVRVDLFSIQPQRVHAELDGYRVADWLPTAPQRRVFVRQTLGLGDPLTDADLDAESRVDDGFPQTLEAYLQETGIRYFKVKVSNQLERDMDRLRKFAALVERYAGDDYRLTLDGNELYRDPAEFDALIGAIEESRELQTLWRNTLAVEQPLARGIALSQEHTAGIRSLCQRKPVIIDESDGELLSYQQAIALGYRGVSSKNCKGPVKSLLNAGLTWLRNQQAGPGMFVMTAEDLCSVGIIPTQSDLCLAAMLGVTHVERNGHHYHPGLSYLPETQQREALEKHSDFYWQHRGRISPHIQAGCFEIGSLQCPGYGFAVIPDMESMRIV